MRFSDSKSHLRNAQQFLFQVPVTRLGSTLHYSTIMLVELLWTSWYKLEEHNDKIGFLFLFSRQQGYHPMIRMNRNILFQITSSACVFLLLFWIFEAFKYLLYVSEHPYWISLFWFFPEKTDIKWFFSQQ